MLLLPHRDGKSVGGCLAVSVTSSCCVFAIAANLLIGGGNVLSLLRVVGPVGCVSASVSSSSSLLTVVYQKPKLLAEKESFQLSAFSFGRRNQRLNMAEILEKP